MTNSIEAMEERNYLIMPFNNKWYRLKMRFACTYIHAIDNETTERSINNEARKRCENVYRRICSDYTNQNIAIMEIEAGKTFVFNSQHDDSGNLQKVTCNDFSQFKQMN